ncbi:MAG: phytoene/squalene synthase family protein [Alphaproteobacteria bacterium]
MGENYRHCEALVRAADKDRYLATLFAPAETRGPLLALYAFDREIASVRDRARAPMPGEIRLQWWRDVINGERAGEAAANPVAAALTEIIARYSLPKPPLLDLIEAHAFDLYDDPMPTFQALHGYLRHTSAAVFDLAAQICGARAGHASECAGLAYGMTQVLRSFALNASRRQLFVPFEALDDATTPGQIFAGQTSPSLADALRGVRDRARKNFEMFESLLPELPAATMPAFLPAALVRGYLSAMERPDYDPFRSAVEIPQWRRQWVLWRAARRYSGAMRG